jgi:hypothetical protein
MKDAAGYKDGWRVVDFTVNVYVNLGELHRQFLEDCCRVSNKSRRIGSCPGTVALREREMNGTRAQIGN